MSSVPFYSFVFWQWSYLLPSRFSFDFKGATKRERCMHRQAVAAGNEMAEALIFQAYFDLSWDGLGHHSKCIFPLLFSPWSLSSSIFSTLVFLSSWTHMWVHTYTHSGNVHEHVLSRMLGILGLRPSLKASAVCHLLVCLRIECDWATLKQSSLLIIEKHSWVYEDTFKFCIIGGGGNSEESLAEVCSPPHRRENVL